MKTAIELIAAEHRMDVKTALSYLEDRSGKRISVSLPDQRANEIADLIRQQEKDAVKVQLFDKYPEFVETIGELDRAIADHSPMNSAHEGYAVIKEELDELWDEIKKRNPDPDLLRLEARQVAAMGIRFMIDILRAERSGEDGHS